VSIIIIIITNENIKVMLSRKRYRGTLQDSKKGEISKSIIYWKRNGNGVILNHKMNCAVVWSALAIAALSRFSLLCFFVMVSPISQYADFLLVQRLERCILRPFSALCRLSMTSFTLCHFRDTNEQFENRK